MPLIDQVFEHLPGVDATPSEIDLESIKQSLLSQLPPDHGDTPHPALPPAYEALFGELVRTEHERIASGKSRPKGIDTTRYETLDAPATNASEDWHPTLKQAYTSYTHLSIRTTNLDLLEEHGKNAWLISNANLEHELGKLERELAAVQADAAALDAERQGALAEAQGEFEVLDETWRKGVGRALEAEIAGEELRRAILERHRAGG